MRKLKNVQHGQKVAQLVMQQNKVKQLEKELAALQQQDDSKPPGFIHFGYRADRFPREAGQCRWWLSQGWYGQFDIISWQECEARKKMAGELGIPVFDYDEMCWD